MQAMRASSRHEDSFPVKHLAGALLIHVALGLLLVGFNWRKQQAIVPQLAINAVLVDRATLNQLAKQQAAPEPQPTPAKDTQQEEQEKQRAEQERLKQEQLKQEQLKQEQTKQEQLKQQQQVELAKTQEKQRLLAETEKQKQADQQRQADQAAQKKQQQEAEQKRVADIQQKQREAELKRQADADAKAQASKEAELKAQLAAEEGRSNAVNAGLLNQYVAMIQQKVMRNWIKPPTAKSGLECEVKVAQAVGGTVLSVEVGRCNGDAAVKSSIEAAVQRASPLPSPPDERLFERNLLFIFKPTE